MAPFAMDSKCSFPLHTNDDLFPPKCGVIMLAASSLCPLGKITQLPSFLVCKVVKKIKCANVYPKPLDVLLND